MKLLDRRRRRIDAFALIVTEDNPHALAVVRHRAFNEMGDVVWVTSEHLNSDIPVFAPRAEPFDFHSGRRVNPFLNDAAVLFSLKLRSRNWPQINNIVAEGNSSAR
jgi:hypothetical protein